MPTSVPVTGARTSSVPPAFVPAPLKRLPPPNTIAPPAFVPRSISPPTPAPPAASTLSTAFESSVTPAPPYRPMVPRRLAFGAVSGASISMLPVSATNRIWFAVRPAPEFSVKLPVCAVMLSAAVNPPVCSALASGVRPWVSDPASTSKVPPSAPAVA